MKKIDLHAHYISPGFISYLDKYYDGHGDGVKTPIWTVSNQLDFMDKQNIDYALLSISSPQISSEDKSETTELSFEVNEYGNDFTTKNSDKLGYMASLPLPFVAESVKMVNYALNELSAKGFILPTNANGIYLGDEILDPIMEALNERHALVSIHPVQPEPLNNKVNHNLPIPLMEFFFDTTRTIVNMAENKIFSHYPNIKWIIPHLGAVLPIIAPRISSGVRNLDVAGDRDDVMEILEKSYFDIAGVSVPYQLMTLLKIADPKKIVYGSDTPYTNTKASIHMANRFVESEEISKSEKQNIFYNNAFNLLKGHMGHA